MNNYRFFFVFILFFPLFGADLFTGIDQQVQVSTSQERVATGEIVLKTREEKVFWQGMQSSMRSSLEERLSRIESKIRYLDSFPPGMSREEAIKLKETQTKLFGIQTRVAREIVARTVLEKKSFSSDSGSEAQIHTPVQVMNEQARLLYEKLPKANKEGFEKIWTGALVDGKTRQDFASLVAMNRLYGESHPLVKSLYEKLQQDSVYLPSSGSPLSGDERSDFIYSLVKDRASLFSLPVREKLQKIAILEESLSGLLLGSSQFRVHLRRIEREKDGLLSYLQKDGLALQATDFSGIETEFLDFFRNRQKKEDSLAWPFEPETRKLLNPLEGALNPVPVKEQQKLYSLFNATLSKVDSKEIVLDSLRYQASFFGSFDLLKKQGEMVKKGDLLAVCQKAGEIRLILKDKLSQKEVDLLSFF